MKNKIFEYMTVDDQEYMTVDDQEYMIVDDQEYGNPDSEYDLNNFGKNGWELCGMLLQADGSRKWYFKREK